MLTIVIGLSFLILVISLVSWRTGLLMVLVIGLLQDVLRKLTPDAPALYIVWSMAILMGIFFAAFMLKQLPRLSVLYFGDRRVRTAWIMFLVIVGAHVIYSTVRWGSPQISILGLIFYFGPPGAMLLAYAYGRDLADLKRFFEVYLVVFTVAAFSVFLSPALEDSWKAFRDVGSFTGKELVIYDIGTRLKSYSGLLRTGEIASWHAATCAAFFAMFGVLDRSLAKKIFFGALILALVSAIFLTGRRKMLMTLTIFFVAQWFLLAYFRRGASKLAVLILVIGTLSSYSFTLLDPSSETSLYVKRGQTVFEDATDRMRLAFSFMRSAFYRSGGVGLGAGASSQGRRYAGGANIETGGAGEAGLGKLVLELGVPGLLAVLALFGTIALRVFKNMKKVASANDRLLVYQASMVAFLFANLVTFTVATQVYGDFFVLIILGLVAGFILKIDRVCLASQPVQTSAAVRP